MLLFRPLFILKILITFFQKGVVIDPLDTSKVLKNKKGEHAPPYHHVDGKGIRKQNDYKKFKSTGPIDKNGKPIKDDDDIKNTAGPSQMHEEHGNT